MSGRYTTTEGAALIGVSPSTIRSWVHRGHLRPGRMVGGSMTWTVEQLQAARARQEEVTPTPGVATLDPTEALCRCGEPPRVTVNDGWAILQCCGAHIAVRFRSGRPQGQRDSLTYPPTLERSIQAHTWREADGLKGTPAVYFIRLGVYMKIGTSADVRRRVRSLSLNRENLMAVIPGGKDAEREKHITYADLRAWGEWFNYQDPLREDVQRMRLERLLAAYPDAARLIA